MPAQKPNLFKRGFKSWAEKTAIEFRHKLSLSFRDHLPAIALAEHLDVIVYPISAFPGDTACLHESGWSALTMNNCLGRRLIVFNSFHSPARQQSDLMHELAHIICGHKVPDKYKDMILPSDVRNFNEQDEAEAQYLGGCLQVPREALVWAFRYRLNEEQIAQRFDASLDMIKYRIRVTGVINQINRWRK